MLEGAVLIDKPSGMTSMDVIRQLRKKCKTRRIGHSGTLDPLATGLLVVLLGRATKLQDIFLNSDKSYSGLIRLGLSTETFDIQGENHEYREVPDSIADNKDIFSRIREQFEGEQLQQPPVYSALKVNGVASHRLARQGKNVELKKRAVRIRFDDLRFHSSKVIRFEVTCSKGTYIRSLARDIGDFLGCGACIESLRRTMSEPFLLENAVSLDTFLEQDISKSMISMEDLVSEMPRVEVSESDFSRLEMGQQDLLSTISLSSDQQVVALFEEKRFGGLIEKRNEGAWKLKFLLPREIVSNDQRV